MELKHIFRELFAQEPIVVKIPNWTMYSPEEFVLSNGLEPAESLFIGLSARTDSEFHFYNDSYQSHISGMVTPIVSNRGWSAPLEAVVRQMIKEHLPIRGFNLYFMGMPVKKKGKTYELLMKCGISLALNEVFGLEQDRMALVSIISGSNNDSVLDTLFLNQIFRYAEVCQQEQKSILKE